MFVPFYGLALLILHLTRGYTKGNFDLSKIQLIQVSSYTFLGILLWITGFNTLINS